MKKTLAHDEGTLSLPEELVIDRNCTRLDSLVSELLDCYLGRNLRRNDVDRNEEIKIRAKSFEQNLNAVAKNIGIQMAPIAAGILYDEIRQTCTLIYAIVYAASKRLNCSHEVSYATIEDSDTWLVKFETLLQEDMHRIIHEEIGLRSQQTKPYTIV